jgi:hypothetical protein
MAGLTADDLLIGPRGRGVCLAVAHWLHAQVWSVGQASDEAGRAAFIRALEAIEATPESAWSDPLAFLEPID